MNTDVEDLLREGMADVTAGLRAPDGMVPRAVRRRRRRLALASAAAVAGTLGTCAVILAAVAVPGARDAGTGTGTGTGKPAVDTAYVVQRVESALSAGPDQIAQMTVTNSGMPFWLSTEEWSYSGQWRSVAYSTGGKPLLDSGVGPSSVYTLVNYPGREWARQRGAAGSWYAPASAPSGFPGQSKADCGQMIGLPLLFGLGLPGNSFSGLPPATVVKDLRTAVSCGTLVDSGRQLIGGIDAIKLTSSQNSFIPETIWVDPSTYQPVRIVVRMGSGTQTADITWLQPTAENLAKLTVSIPAGFRQVPLSEARYIQIP